MTTGKEIVEEFHRHTFFYESIADEWLANRIDDAIRAAVEAQSKTCVEIADQCAEEFETHAENAETPMNRVLNQMGASDCRRVGTKIREAPKKAKGAKK